MDYYFQKVAQRLAIAAASLAGGSAAATELEGIPEEVLEEALEESGFDNWKSQDRHRLARLLCLDSRAAVRLRLVQHVQACRFPLTEEEEDWLMTLADDPSPTVQLAFADNLHALLERAPELERTYIVTNWALSPLEGVRLAIARVVSLGIDGVGVRWTIDYLETDESAEVRAVALHAKQTLG